MSARYLALIMFCYLALIFFMKTEVSAGGIVVHNGKNQWYVLILKDMNNTWTFPKGLIETGETPEVAAGREIAEEVGTSRLTLLARLPPVTYFYERNGRIKKTVQYFIFESPSRARPKPQKQEGISEARWVKLGDATQMIGYRQTNVKLLEETRNAITQGVALQNGQQGHAL